MPFKTIFALDKWARLRRMVKASGGIRKSLYKMWRFDTLKDGKLVGYDMFGNKYYENKMYMIGRNRWVEFHDMVKWDYDASQVTAEWYGWLHNKTDRTPCDDCAKYELYCCCWVANWLQPHEENLSGTCKSFYPYSSVRPHIHLWDGNIADERKKCDKSCP